jgi:hypothetical protein
MSQKCAPRYVIGIALVLAALSGDAQVAFAGNTWDGGGSTNNWSDPGNWDPDGLPTGTQLTFSGGNRTLNTQDLANPYILTAITFSASAAGFDISGSPLAFPQGGTITNNGSLGRQMIVSPIQVGGIVTIASAMPVDSADLGLGDISGPGGLNVNGALILSGNQTYTGATTVKGRLCWEATSSGLGDIDVTGEAFVAGTVGLAPGKRIRVSGNFEPGGGGLKYDPGSAIINGDLILDAKYAWEAYPSASSSFADQLAVSGLLDLSGANAFQDFYAAFFGRKLVPGSYLVATYGNRIGEFDSFTAQPGAQLVYTSLENSGAGQILLIVPEPTGLSVVAFALAGLSIRKCRWRGQYPTSTVSRNRFIAATFLSQGRS